MSFKKWSEIRNKWEGGIGNRPLVEDKAGLTVRGVTIGYWMGGAHSIVGKPNTAAALLTITESEANKIAKVGFWDKYKIDSIRNPALRMLVADAIYNSGAGSGLKSFGYRSISDLNKDVFATPNKLKRRRLSWLQGLSNWRYNGKGWTNRINDLTKGSNRILLKRVALIGGGLAVAGVGGYYLYRKLKK